MMDVASRRRARKRDDRRESISANAWFVLIGVLLCLVFLTGMATMDAVSMLG